MEPGRRPHPAIAQRRTAVHVIAAVVLAAVGVVVLGGAEPAAAHSFLVSTSPAQGERLASAPQAIVLEFSEPVDPASVIIEVDTASGRLIPAGPVELASGGLEVRVAVEALGDAIYVVAWEALSAIDGHGSAGEFAFAVGDASGTIPAATASSSTSVAGVATSAAFFAGLAIAAGTLVLQAAGRDVDPPVPMVLRAGLLVAMTGTTAALLRAHSGELQLVLCLQALAIGLLAVGLVRAWVVPAAAVAVAAGLWSTRSHGATGDGVVGWTVDVVHLVAGASWAGSLALATWAGWQRHRRGERWLPLVRAYARVAVVLAVALGIAGVVAAIELLPSWRSLWHTGFGRLIIIKVVLFVSAIALAGTSRWWALRVRRSDRLRRTMTAEGIVLVAALVVAAVLVNGAPPQPVAAAEQLLGPPPLQGQVIWDAGLAGQLNVELAADGDRLDVRVFGPSGPVRGTDVDINVRAPDESQIDLVPRSCGRGCFTQPLPLPDGLTTVSVTVAAPDWPGGTYRAQLVWPPGRPAAELLGEVVARMRDVPELTVTEIVSSGPGATAPPGMFTLSGERFIAAEPYASANVDDVRLLPGEPPRLVLYLPGSQIYGQLELDSSGRIASARLVTSSHEIIRTFSYPEPDREPYRQPADS